MWVTTPPLLSPLPPPPLPPGVSSSKDKRQLWKQYPKSQAGYEINMIAMDLSQYFGFPRSFWFPARVSSSTLHMNPSEGLDMQSSKGKSVASGICNVSLLKPKNQSCCALPS